MVAQKGRDYLIKLNTTGSTYVGIGGMQEPSIEISNEPVDITNADSAGVRTLLEGAGVNSMTIKGKGVFVDDAVAAQLRTAAALNQHKNFQFVVPGTAVKTFQGSFMISKMTESSTFKESGAYDFQLESAGPVTIS